VVRFQSGLRAARLQHWMRQNLEAPCPHGAGLALINLCSCPLLSGKDEDEFSGAAKHFS